MPVVAVSTPFNISLDLNIAPFWKRLLAYMLDALILLVYALACNFLISDRLPVDEGTHKLVELLIVVLPAALYHFLMEVFFSGQSVGKRVLRIRVVNFTGNEAGISQYLIRMLFRSYTLVPMAVIIVLSFFYDLTSAGSNVLFFGFFILYVLSSLGLFLYYILNAYGQRLGDTLANTLVIETRAEADFHKTIYLEIADEAYQVRYPEVMRLSDRDINGIRNLLDVKRITKDTEQYMQRIAHRIEEVLGIRSGQEPYDFLAQLLRDYNYLTSR